MQDRGGTTRGNATTSRRINESWCRDERQCEVESAQQEVTQQPAGENEKGRGGRRWRLRVERQPHNENSATRGDATTSQGKQEGNAKASVTPLQPQ
jgi:hypothetical protein